jgi:hypothetical protein
MALRINTVLLFLAVALSAACASAPRPIVLTDESEHLYVNPLRVIALSDGTHFIIRQPRNYPGDEEAMTAHTVDPSTGEVLRFYSARHGLAQPRDIRGEKYGQVYGAALLQPRSDGRKRMVLSAGWPDSKERLRFALLIVRENREGIWRPDGRIDGIGRAGDLAVTGDGSILAVTSDPAGGVVAHPALTLVSSGGTILATYFPRAEGIDGGRLFIRARIQSLGGNRFAFHDGLNDVIETFRIDPATHELKERRSVHIPALQDEGEVAHVRGWHVDADGSIRVLRSEREERGVRNLVSRWSAAGEWLDETNEAQLLGAFWTGDDLRVVRVNQHDVAIDSVP